LRPFEMDDFAAPATRQRKQGHGGALQRMGTSRFRQSFTQALHLVLTEKALDLALAVALHAIERVAVLREVAPALGLVEHGLQYFHCAIGSSRPGGASELGMPAKRVGVANLIEELPSE